MNIIFLDIDGVLNGYGPGSVMTWRIFKKIGLNRWYHNHRRDPFGVHKEKVKRLAKIVKETNSKIVMSSSWRDYFWRVPDNEKTGRQKELADMLKKYKIEVIGITPRLKDGRDKEIQTWMDENKDKVKQYIILDDERSLLHDMANDPRFIQTSSVTNGTMITGSYKEKTGLKRKHVKTAIEILNRKEG